VQKLRNIWSVVINELTNKHIATMDPRNLAIISKTVSAQQINESALFWQAVNNKFQEIEADIDLHNFSFIVYGFVTSRTLDPEGFLRCTTRALLRNSEQINWRDFSMILTVAHKLAFTK
jgi:hypothetical protein